MRTLLTCSFFALVILVAACGGGGKSGVIPSTPINAGGGNSAPTSTKNTTASMRFYIPPANKQASRKPFYISSATQAFAIYVEPYPSSVPTGFPSPVPTGIQVFPVTTPSPCAAASGGGETCTFTVTAPIGTDLFVVAALPSATTSPLPLPLSAYLSGPVAVGASPAASPLAFTLDGVVNSAAVAVASPDPGNTPNTQLFTAGVPAAASLTVTAYDVNGNVILSSPAQTYFNPVVISVSPASEGLTLSLTGSSSCGSSASGATATIDCGADLGNLQVSYDGTPHPDPSDHLYDTFTVAATAEPSAAPSPAHYVLGSNVLSWQLVSDLGTDSIDYAYMYTLSNGNLVYLADNNGEDVLVGSFDPSTETGTTPVQNPDGYFDLAAIASDGSLWIANEDESLDCFASITATTPTVSGFVPYSPISEQDEFDVGNVGIDRDGNLWYSGGDESDGEMFAGFFPTSGCSVPESATAQFAMIGDSAEESTDYPYFAALPNGSVQMQAYYSPSGTFLMSPSPPPEAPSPVASIAPLNPNASGGGIVSDQGGTLYGLFVEGSNGSDVESLAPGAGAFTSVLTLPSYEEELAEPDAPALFSPNGGAADRLAYEDDSFYTLGIVESVSSSPMPLVVALPNDYETFAPAYSSKGGLYALVMDASGNLDMDRLFGTKTWTALPVLYSSECSTYGYFSIIERGDSGPFNLSFSGGVTATPFTGTDHTWDLSIPGSLASFTVTVVDNGGRTETYTESANANVSSRCGARKRLSHRRARRPRQLGIKRKS